MNDVWDMLSEPFLPEELLWRVEELSDDKKRALVAPHVTYWAVLDRLDEAVGIQGWQDSYELLQTPPAEAPGNYAVKCRLIVMGISKEDLGEGDSLRAAFSEALKRAAVKFGVGRFLYRLDKQWVDHDPDTGKFSIPSVAMAPAEYKSLTSEAKAPPPEARAESLRPATEAKPEPQELIDRLIERLKEAGLGKQTAQIVTKYGGYGKHPDETRKLYGELRALLKGQAS
jgi:hypothetical protein